jgi:hypothetical protein
MSDPNNPDQSGNQHQTSESDNVTDAGGKQQRTLVEILDDLDVPLDEEALKMRLKKAVEYLKSKFPNGAPKRQKPES